MSIKGWLPAERPRERLLAGGAGRLSDAELLALFVGSGPRGQDAVSFCRQLLARVGSLRELLLMPREQMLALPGLGPARVAKLLAIMEVSQRLMQQKAVLAEAITDPQVVGELMRARMRGYQQEVFAVLFLDNRHGLLAIEELFQGTVNMAPVYPREVLKRCLAHNAAAVILAHNHPSGGLEPSDQDLAITRDLARALSYIQVRVLDHLVVADTGWTSLATRGLMECAA